MWNNENKEYELNAFPISSRLVDEDDESENED